MMLARLPRCRLCNEPPRVLSGRNSSLQIPSMLQSEFPCSRVCLGFPSRIGIQTMSSLKMIMNGEKKSFLFVIGRYQCRELNL